MEFRQLKSLRILAECGSITQAAAAVHLTPAAIHKQLKQLEDELAVPLYERKNGRMRLTGAAETLLPYLRDILGQYESAVLALEEWKGVRRGLIRIGAGPSLSIYLLPAVLKAFHLKYPNVDLDIQTGSSVQLLESLKAGAIDLALLVATGPVNDRSLHVAVERQVEIVLVSSMPGVPRKCSLSRLSQFPFFLFRKGARIESLIEAYLDACGVTPNVNMRFDSAEALKSTLLTAIGVALLPNYSVREEIRSGRLRRIRQKEQPLFMKMHLLMRGNGFVPPAVREFVTLAKQIWTSEFGPADL